MKLEDIARGQSLVGVTPNEVVTVRSADFHGPDTLELVYRTPSGALGERLLQRDDETSIHVATDLRPWSFDGDPASFQLACEAKRIDLAFLFDPMMAVHTANVDPLPHQITAVYESMLPRTPLRFVLADDPGAGKTIMAGLYIRELLLRADARRILVVAPGSLVEQWRDELHEKFGLEFRIYSPQLEQASPSGNPFEDFPQLIVRLDQIARREDPGDLQDKLCQAGWDLVICDEAHKLAAHYFGSEVKTTARFRFAQKVGAHTRHLLLMTATPHNGKEEDYQLFLSLLDSDRFYGKFRDGVHKVDASDLMRRMVKEELLKFDGSPLFPERKAYTVNYTLSPLEAALYESVTQYVRTEMGKADQLTGARKGSVGFALTALQRRLASSPEAIFQSLRRRKERLESRINEERLALRGQQLLAATFPGIPTPPEDEDDLDANEQEELDEALVDQATAAQSITELEAEIEILKGLVAQAKAVVVSGQDRKWDELSKLLQHDPHMRDASTSGPLRQRKLIIFSEHRDTLNYLHARIAGVLGTPDAIATIHGGTHRDERRKVQALFRSDPAIRVLIATDAAGEGVNLQNANLMVNYDLPWNPNRLEQRFGRIHRIGQTEVCHLWNLVAKETREGDVYHRLLDKLAVESEALKGRVFDILGEVFEDKSLKDLLIEAIRYGDQPEVRARLTTTIDTVLDRKHLTDLLERNALAQESMSADRLFALKEEMDKAEARRLQPRFVRAYFTRALDLFGGTMHPREAHRYELTHVPANIRERDRLITGRNRREQEPVLKRYERICFDKSAIAPPQAPDKQGASASRAVLMHPGHPLMLAMTDLLLEKHQNLLRQGTILVDPANASPTPWLLILLTHEVKSGDGTTLSRRMHFVRVNPDGSSEFAGWAPHLDLDPIDPADRPLVDDLLAAPWLTADLEARAIALASTTLAPAHYREIAERRIEHIDKTLVAVNERLTKEIAFWTDRWTRLKEDLDAGKDVRLNVQMADRTIRELADRLDARKKELQSMRHVTSSTPTVLGAALVVPELLLSARRQAPIPSPTPHPDDTAETTEPLSEKQIDPYEVDPKLRMRTERLAMQAVRRAEEARGFRVVDVSAEKCGWDLTAYPPVTEGRQPEPRHIEVKGRLADQNTICVTRNEILCAMNQADKFVLAIVLVDREDDDKVDGPYYIRNPFDREPGWGVASINYRLEDLLARAQA